MARRRVVHVFLGAIGLVVVGLVAWCGYAVGSKEVDPGWERCGLSDGVHDLAVTGDGRILAAVNWMKGGDVVQSEDRCETFADWRLSTEVVWGIDWLPGLGTACAAIRGGLVCEDHRLDIRQGDAKDLYWTVESDGNLIVGGQGAHVFRNGSWDDANAPRGVHHAAVVTEGRVYLSTHLNSLAVSEDDGVTFEIEETPRASVLAAAGPRIYAAGGVFGGYLRRSADGGKTWQEVEMPGSQPEVLLVPFDDPDIVLLGTHGDVRTGAAFLSRDGGLSWTDIGCPGQEIHALAVDDQYVYCGGKGGPMPKKGEVGLWRRSLSDLGIDSNPR